jgi:Rrf2 family nitric oxide-sensitive transcriptional repressor
MRLTAFTDYALRTLTYLALRPDRLSTIAEIASSYRISANHLMKVVQQQAQAGNVVTLRGQHGGLRLARPAAEITIGSVVRQTEPDLQLVNCFGAQDCCAIQSDCRLAGMLREALQAFLAVLDRYTLADLVARPAALAELLGLGTDPEQEPEASAMLSATPGPAMPAADEARVTRPVPGAVPIIPSSAQPVARSRK